MILQQIVFNHLSGFIAVFYELHLQAPGSLLMKKRIIHFIFFSNYFIGILAIALALETAFQLRIPLNVPAFYLLLFSATVLYYTRAYIVPQGIKPPVNPRTAWYAAHATFTRKSQFVLSITALASLAWLLYHNYKNIMALPFYYWLLLLSIPLASLLYYGLLPGAFLKFNLRNTGWLKAFVIGFVWAGCVSILPVAAIRLEQPDILIQPGFLLWLFIKNWMFCTVNAIMFDLKDYADDANRQLKTFVVRFGLRKTIFFVLMPLLLIGLSFFLLFAVYNGFSALTVLFNMFPLICLLLVAWSLHRRKPILYYLVVIDGLLLLKACCGIAGMMFV